jgi:hypothetical protein
LKMFTASAGAIGGSGNPLDEPTGKLRMHDSDPDLDP